MFKKPKTIVLTILLILLLCFSGPLIVYALEDYEAYTETDPNNNITVYNSTHIYQYVIENEDAYVYDDKGVNYFGANFLHTVDAQVDDIGAQDPMGFCWLLSNVVNDRKDLIDNNRDHIALRLQDDRIALEENDGGTLYADLYMTSPEGKWYYFTISKTGVSLDVSIYNNTARTAGYLEDTLHLGLHTPPSYQYIFATQIRNRGLNKHLDLYVAYLDIGIPLEYVEPQYNLLGLNSTLNGSVAQFTFNLTDNAGLDFALFETNNTGTLTNTSYDLGDSLTLLLLINQTLNETSGIRVDYRLLFNDTSNNWNATVQHFLFTNTEPIIGLTVQQLFIGAVFLLGFVGMLFFLARRKRK